MRVELKVTWVNTGVEKPLEMVCNPLPRLTTANNPAIPSGVRLDSTLTLGETQA